MSLESLTKASLATTVSLGVFALVAAACAPMERVRFELGGSGCAVRIVTRAHAARG
jgi:hypothetical protein